MTNAILKEVFLKTHDVQVGSLVNNKCELLCSERTPLWVLDELRRALLDQVFFTVLPHEQFIQASQQHVQASSSATDSTEQGEWDWASLLADLPTDREAQAPELFTAPMVRLLDHVLREAMKLRASDIHVDPSEDSLLIRLRVDGVLKTLLRAPKLIAPYLLARVKILAHVDIAESRLPQDGRFTFRYQSHDVDVRMATLPSKHGERVVLRLLDPQQSLGVQELGMSEELATQFHRWLGLTQGMILVTGPTGSGKTTTLYAGLQHLADGSRNIMTIEDPIEYVLSGVIQSQVQGKIDYDFAAGLRAMLRQDPDVILVGELRDAEAARIAVQASLTGHLVLSTLHTNRAIAAVTRLRDLGIEAFLLSATLSGLLAQRLLRRLCASCKKSRRITSQESSHFHLPENTEVFDSMGCVSCNHTGFFGRVAVYECIDVDHTMKQMIYDGASESLLQEYVNTKSHDLFYDGVRLLRQGITSVDEIARVLHHANL